MNERGPGTPAPLKPTRDLAPAGVATLALVALLAGPTCAQIAPPSSLGLPGPGDERPPLPDFRPDEAPAFELPPLPRPDPDRPATGARVLVRALRVIGNTVFTEEELAAVAAPYLGRRLATEELLALRDALTRHYVTRGYINSGAVVPDQVVEDGILEVRIIEGELGEIRISGATSLLPSFVEDRLRPGAGPPLDVNALGERIQLLLADPAIDRIDARLGPGVRAGEARLEVDITEAPRFQPTVRVANDRSPSIGSLHGELSLTIANLVGLSDPLRFELGLTEGVRHFGAGYSVPLTARDLRFFLAAEVTDSRVVEEPFSEIDVESEHRRVQLGLSWPVLRTLDDELRLELALERERSTTFLLGRRFSFSPGVQDGRSDVTALRLAQQWQHRSQDQVLVLRSTESLGLDALGATRNPGEVPDGRFFTWLGQAQYARRLGDAGWQIRLRADVQLTPDPLLPIERIGIGGLETVRGYRENQLVRDSGWITSAELGIPLGRVQIPGLAQGPDDGAVQLVPFVDAGGGWNNATGTPDPKLIYSVGTGLRWQPSPRVQARLDFGVPLRSVPEPDQRDLQDLGLHFEIRAALY